MHIDALNEENMQTRVGLKHYLKNNDFTKQFVFGLFLNEKILIFYYRQLDPFFVESYISWYFFKYRFFVSCK